MRRFTRLVAVAAGAAALVLVVPVPASAGGPTSVLLVSPGRHATASLYTTDEAYARLLRMVGENPVADPAAPDVHGGPGSDAINVTWLVHDVQIWRVDRVFTDAAGGPWIETVLLTEGGSAFEKPGVKHRATDPKELVALLSALKLLGESPPAAYDGAKAPVAKDQQQVSQPVATVAAERDVANIQWLWVLIGAAAGVVLVIGFRPLVRRLRPN
jgi:hypothetical protein